MYGYTIYRSASQRRGQARLPADLIKKLQAHLKEKPILNKLLKSSVRSYMKIFGVGILVGCICRLADYFPADTLWSFSSIQTLVGFWIITNTIIVLLSTSNICAGISSFLYMFGMTLSFYGLQAILGMFIPLFSGGFRRSLFVMFTVLSIPCAIAAFILYYLNKDNLFY